MEVGLINESVLTVVGNDRLRRRKPRQRHVRKQRHVCEQRLKPKSWRKHRKTLFRFVYFFPELF